MCVSRVGFGVAPKQAFPVHCCRGDIEVQRKFRDREDAFASPRDACATQSLADRAA